MKSTSTLTVKNGGSRTEKRGMGFSGSASSVRRSSLNATVRDQSGAGRAKIGEILSKEGYITSLQLEEALNYQNRNQDGSGGFIKISHILTKLGYIDEDTVPNVLGRLYKYPVVRKNRLSPSPEALELLPYEEAKAHMAFPLKVEDGTFVLTMTEPTDTSAVEKLQAIVKKDLKVSVSSEKDIIEAFKEHYGIDEAEYNSFFSTKFEEDKEDALPITEVDDFGSLVSEAAGEIELQSTIEEEDDQYLASDAPIIKLVNGMIIKAINDGISDIHIEPFEKALQVRYRLDGALFKSMNLPITIKNALTSRLKILAGLNIAERRVPQDGRIKMRLGKTRAVDLRVSTLPTLFGESVVLRILDKGALNVDLTKMGFEHETQAQLLRCVNQPYGILLVTGPTGSGKTTTLYSVLNYLNQEDTKILTAEDPVEFNFKGINQVNVKEEVGMTFAASLRAFLRQDPDVIMVGEIRDLETAEIAMKAAMTGHLVFSTVHTNDSPSTISRLIDIGIPSYLLASSLTMVLSQRLVRKLCPNCKIVRRDQIPVELERMGFSKEEIPELTIYGPVGCPECNGTGYRGRTGLYELMEVTDEVSKAINAMVPEDQLRKIAIQEGMVTLRDAGLEKIRKGVTSVEEVLRRTAVTKEAMPAYLVNPDVEKYQDKDAIIREGNRDNDFFKLVQGAVVVVKDGKKIAEISEPGEYFGEMSAITGEPRSASVISKGRSVIKRFPGDKLMDVIERYPDVAKHLFQVLAGRLNRAGDIIVNLINDRINRN